jgi:cytochrome b involved in lipid metabolism
MMDFAGKDADDMFEDIGHSTGAREKLRTLVIGKLKYDPAAAEKQKKEKKSNDAKARGGLNPVAIVLLLIAIAIGIYFSQRK